MFLYAEAYILPPDAGFSCRLARTGQPIGKRDFGVSAVQRQTKSRLVTVSS